MLSEVSSGTPDRVHSDYWCTFVLTPFSRPRDGFYVCFLRFRPCSRCASVVVMCALCSPSPALLEQKKKFAAESLEVNCKNPAFRKLFPELVELNERREAKAAAQWREVREEVRGEG